MSLREMGGMLWAANRQLALMMCLLVSLTILSGCGLLGLGPEEAPEATPVRALVPTFTPTPEGAGPAEDEQPADQPVSELPAMAEDTVEPVVVEAPPTETPTPEPPTPEPPTPTPAPKVVIDIPSANVRIGPGTNYGLVGTVNSGDTFDIIGKNGAGDWWQICCVNGQEAWIFGDIVRAENANDVPVAANIPEPPPVAVQPPPEPQPVAPAEPEQPAPQPEGDPCAGIGGDGCKFRKTGGPLFAPNGGSEIKMQLFFKHSGVEGGQPQGSYFVGLMKDGTRLPVSDGVRSIALDKSEGPMGPYNYEYKIGIGDIPGGTVAGNYTMWVLDGNGERDSQNINITIPEGQGELWVEWDQG